MRVYAIVTFMIWGVTKEETLSGVKRKGVKSKLVSVVRPKVMKASTPKCSEKVVIRMLIHTDWIFGDERN